LLHGLFHCEHNAMTNLPDYVTGGDLVSAGLPETPLPNGPDVAVATEVEG
jgi:hypothetical protein